MRSWSFPIRHVWALVAVAAVTGCSLTPPPARVPVTPPASWRQPMPVEVAASEPVAATGLADPLLDTLIERARAASPDLASARTRVAEARAALVAAGAALGPQLNGQLAATRSNSGVTSSQTGTAPATVLQFALQPQWEIDLFGALGAARRAAGQRAMLTQAQLASAHVALAAEVANAYVNAVSCLWLQELARSDAASRQETARLTGLSAQAGFTAPADAALARAAAADAAARARDTQLQCDVAIQTLVALTASEEAPLRQALQALDADLPWRALVAVPEVPAQLLYQRPDVAAAEAAVAAASADVGEAQARRYPRLTLSGSIGVMRVQALGQAASMNTWSLGPLALELPLFDGGTRRANVQAREAAYDEAVVRLHATVREAVREVETALAQLSASQERREQLMTAEADYGRYLRATEARHASGMASLFELEDARRTWLAARQALLTQRRDERLAWIALYRALGGGWTGARPDQP